MAPNRPHPLSGGLTTAGRLRRALFAGVLPLLAGLVAGCAGLPATGPERPPIVFVHGDGDSAALWAATIWRFETNGWPRERLHAAELPFPRARDEDDKPQPARSSTAEAMQYLAAEVDRVLMRTRARQVVLVGNSRGGLVIRNYLKNGGGAPKVSHAVLGGTPNHGIWATDFRLASEFNGKGPFLAGLNAPQGAGGLETTPGVAWLTLRSDGNDKYAQPDGRWIGAPTMATNVGPDSPALRGAENRVLPGVDHRETSYGPAAFGETWRFLTGSAPRTLDIEADSAIVLDGTVTGLAGTTPTNLPLGGARVEVWRVAPDSGERIGGPVHQRTVGADGRWGPFTAQAGAYYEFVLAADGYATTHTYRSPFPRSSSVVGLRAVRLADADRAAGSVVTLVRPRGYFDLQRYAMSLDGKPLPGVPPGVPGVASARLALPEAPARTVVGEFDGERIAVRTWPARDGHLVFAELTH
jgi:pimeloyl-ACP methyl ester carboxylesterase